VIAISSSISLANLKTEKDKTDKSILDEASLADLDSENIKVGKLVHEFLTAQSLKILPQAPFGDAVTQFVDKDDKHAVEAFVNESLTIQVRDLLAREVDEEDLDPAIERLRTQQEKLFADGLLKLPKKKGVLKKRPSAWDSENDGAWEDNDLAYELVSDDEDASPAPTGKRGRAAAVAASDDDDASVISVTTKKPAAKKAPAKKAVAKPRAPAKPKAAPKTTARAKKPTAEPSDDEDDDLIMFDAPPPKAQPRRAAVAKGRQTQLNFSQAQPKTQTAKEPSDDEISDDDAFEPMASSKSSRKR